MRLTDLQLLVQMIMTEGMNSNYISMLQTRLLMHQARRSLSSIRERAALQDVVLNLLSAQVEFSVDSHTVFNHLKGDDKYLKGDEKFIHGFF